MSSFLSAVYKAVIRTVVWEEKGGDTSPTVLLLWQNREGREKKKARPMKICPIGVCRILGCYSIWCVLHLAYHPILRAGKLGAGKKEHSQGAESSFSWGSDQEHRVVTMGTCVYQEPESREQPGSSASFYSHSRAPPDWGWSLSRPLATIITSPPGWFCVDFCFVLVEKVPGQCAHWRLSSGFRNGGWGCLAGIEGFLLQSRASLCRLVFLLLLLFSWA